MTEIAVLSAMAYIAAGFAGGIGLAVLIPRILNWHRRGRLLRRIRGRRELDFTAEKWAAMRAEWVAAGGRDEDWHMRVEQEGVSEL